MSLQLKRVCQLKRLSADGMGVAQLAASEMSSSIGFNLVEERMISESNRNQPLAFGSKEKPSSLGIA